MQSKHLLVSPKTTLKDHNMSRPTRQEAIIRKPTIWFDNEDRTTRPGKNCALLGNKLTKMAIKPTKKSVVLNVNFSVSPCLEDLSKPVSDSLSVADGSKLLDQGESSDNGGYGQYVYLDSLLGDSDTKSNSDDGKHSSLSEETVEYTDGSDGAEKQPTMNKRRSVAKNLNSLVGSGLAVGGAPGSGHEENSSDGEFGIWLDDMEL
mgnify:CR=1 FL=1